MTVTRANMSSEQAAQWLRTHGHDLIQSGQALPITTAAHPFGPHAGSTEAAYLAACVGYERTAELLGAELRRAADLLGEKSEVDGATR